ncbi:H-type small acid-soluble spore protein [Salipaludibacillus sp. HK11]|uniref:H-type small acid-soluble spore protein n=1 Tax=Salipaludibacillus sp. HK11 TaxID=3394320 RepID=UPI0039FBE4F0
MMNKQRAEEISQSPDMKNVTYEGESVYIQHVNNDTARIFPLDNRQHKFDVEISRLVEMELS